MRGAKLDPDEWPSPELVQEVLKVWGIEPDQAAVYRPMEREGRPVLIATPIGLPVMTRELDEHMTQQTAADLRRWSQISVEFRTATVPVQDGVRTKVTVKVPGLLDIEGHTGRPALMDTGVLDFVGDCLRFTSRTADAPQTSRGEEMSGWVAAQSK